MGISLAAADPRSGPSRGKPRTSAGVPDSGTAMTRSGDARRPGTLTIATSSLRLNCSTVPCSGPSSPNASTVGLPSPATTCALVTTRPGAATQPEPSTANPHESARTLTTDRPAALTAGSDPNPDCGAASNPAERPLIEGRGSIACTAPSRSPVDGATPTIAETTLDDRISLRTDAVTGS